MYNSIVVNTFVDSKHMGDLKGATISGTYKSKVGGEVVKLYLKINENLIIEKSSYKTFGGIYINALASVLCEMINNKSISYAKKLSKHDIINVLKNVPEDKVYLAELVMKSLNETIKKYAKKNGIKV